MLIQVIITLAIMAILAVLNASNMKNMADQQETVSRKLVAQGIFNSIMTNMTSGSFCTCNFVDATVNPGVKSVSLPKSLRLFHSTQCDPAMSALIGEKGKELTPPQYGLKLRNVLLDDVQKLDSESYTATLTVDINANNGMSLKPFAIPGILIKIDPSTKKILSCNTSPSTAAVICKPENSADGFDICAKGARIRVSNESDRNILTSLIPTSDPNVFVAECHAPGGRWAKFLLNVTDVDKNKVVINEIKTADHAYKIRMCFNHLLATDPPPKAKDGFCYAANFNGNPDATNNCSSDIYITINNKGTKTTLSSGSCYSKMPAIVGPKCGGSARPSGTCPIVL